VTEAEVIDGVIAREGEVFTHHPADRGGPTRFGITAKTLGVWRALGRAASSAEVAALSRAEAVEIYRHLYVQRPGFLSDRFDFEPLRVQMIDDGVLSGPREAVLTLQALLGVSVDGVFGSQTRKALAAADQRRLHVQYVKARVERLARIVQKDPSQLTFLVGWLRRALGFLDVAGAV
jgi:lysozyme family protein